MGKLMDFYADVIGEDFNPDKQDDRIKMQKVVYLAECKGLNLGGYLFVRKEHGPYSLALRMDVMDEASVTPRPARVCFSEYAKSIIEGIRSLIATLIPRISENEKFELAASLLYLDKNDCRYMAKDKILSELLEWKPAYNKPQYDLDTAWDKIKQWSY